MIGALIKVRTQSKRFPRKALENLAGKPMLVRCIENVQRIFDGPIVVATTKLKSDDELAKVSEKAGAKIYRGAVHDVFIRSWKAMQKFGLAHALEISGDCPFLDEKIAIQVKKAMMEKPEYDYIAPYVTHRNLSGEVLARSFALSYYEKIHSIYQLIPKKVIRRVEGGWAAWIVATMGSTVIEERITKLQIQLDDRFPWADTMIKFSIDWPLELAVANRIVEHIGHYPHDVTEIYNAYREIKKL